MAQVTVGTSVSLKNLGVKAAAKLLAADENVKEMQLGKVWGFAIGQGSRMNDDGTTSEWLSGDFAIERTDTGEEFRSGKAYLGNSLHSLIASKLYDENGNPIRGARITFAYAIVAKRDNNKAGFTWVYRSLMPENAASPDPLSLMKLEMAKHEAAAETKQLEAPKKGGKKEHHNEAA